MTLADVSSSDISESILHEQYGNVSTGIRRPYYRRSCSQGGGTIGGNEVGALNGRTTSPPPNCSGLECRSTAGSRPTRSSCEPSGDFLEEIVDYQSCTSAAGVCALHQQDAACFNVRQVSVTNVSGRSLPM